VRLRPVSGNASTPAYQEEDGYVSDEGSYYEGSVAASPRGGERWARMPADGERGGNKVWYVKRVSNSRSILKRGKTYDSMLTMGPLGVRVDDLKTGSRYAFYGMQETPGWAVDGLYFILKVVDDKNIWKEKVFECRDEEQAVSIRDELEMIVDMLVTNPEVASPEVYEMALRERERREMEKKQGGSGGAVDLAWEEVYTEDGQPYYYNPSTGETAWERPAAPAKEPAVHATSAESPAPQVAASMKTPAPRAAAGDWEEAVTPDGKSYWHSRATGKSTWDMPDEVKEHKERDALKRCRSEAIQLCTNAISNIKNIDDKERLRTDLNELASSIRAVVFRLDNTVTKKAQQSP